MACYLRTEEILRGFLTVNPSGPHPLHLPHHPPADPTHPHSQSPILHFSLPANPRSTSPRQIDTPPLTYPRAASPPPPTPMCASPPSSSVLHPPPNFGNPSTTTPHLYGSSSPINFLGLNQPRTTSPFMPRTTSPNFFMPQPGLVNNNSNTNAFLPRTASPNFSPFTAVQQPRTASPVAPPTNISLPHFQSADFSSNFLRPSYNLAPPPSSTLNLNPMYNLNNYHLSNPPHVHQPQFVPTSHLLDPRQVKSPTFNSPQSKDSRPTTITPIPRRDVQSPSAFSPPNTPSSPPYPDTPPNTPYQPDPEVSSNSKKSIFTGKKWAFYDDGRQSFYEESSNEKMRESYDDEDTDMDTDTESPYDQSNKIT